jgi:hypothetical protein
MSKSTIGGVYVMTDFKIRRGLSTVLFTEPGVVNPRLVIEEGCWYLCTDTAELFLGVLAEGVLSLKRINEKSATGNGPSYDNGNLEELEQLIDGIDERLVVLEQAELFRCIEDETYLPTDFESASFDPNITYYVKHANGSISTFIFDRDSLCYLCTNNVHDTIITQVQAAIDEILESRFDAKLPEAIERTLGAVILYGGDATPED